MGKFLLQIVCVDFKELSNGVMVKLSNFLCQLIGRSSGIRCLVLNIPVNNRHKEVQMMKNALEGAAVNELVFPSLANFDRISA